MRTNSIFYVLCFALFFSVNVNAQIGAKVAPGVTNIKGELGIGTTSSADFNPNAALHLKTTGSEMATFESSASSKWISLYEGITRKGILWNSGNTMTLRSDLGNVRFQTLGNNTRMDIGDDGDIGVGLGATATRGKFHILNASGIDDPELNLSTTGTGFARLEFGNSGGDGYWHIAADANGTPKMNFWYDEDGSAGPIVGENVMTIDGDQQRVGIGTSSPSTKLEINGATGGAGQFVRIDLTDDTGLNAGNDLLEINAPSTAADGVNLIEAQRGGTIVFQVNANGQTSVGGSNLVPTGYLFAVDGKMVGEELLIEDSGSWPDYVFAKDYELKTLAEVEASIKANGHLPGIPSASVVEAEGIKSGQMHKLTMEKVEELTLYAIDADKKIEALNKENTALKNTLEELIKRIEQLEKK